MEDISKAKEDAKQTVKQVKEKSKEEISKAKEYATQAVNQAKETMLFRSTKAREQLHEERAAASQKIAAAVSKAKVKLKKSDEQSVDLKQKSSQKRTSRCHHLPRHQDYHGQTTGLAPHCTYG